MLTKIKNLFKKKKSNAPEQLPSVESLLQTLDKEGYVLVRGYITTYDDGEGCYYGCLLSALAWLNNTTYGQASGVYGLSVEDLANLESGFEGWEGLNYFNWEYYEREADTSNSYYQYGQRVAKLAGLERH